MSIIEKEIQLESAFYGIQSGFNKKSTVNTIDLGNTVNIVYENSYSAEGTK